MPTPLKVVVFRTSVTITSDKTARAIANEKYEAGAEFGALFLFDGTKTAKSMGRRFRDTGFGKLLGYLGAFEGEYLNDRSRQIGEARTGDKAGADALRAEMGVSYGYQVDPDVEFYNAFSELPFIGNLSRVAFGELVVEGETSAGTVGLAQEIGISEGAKLFAAGLGAFAKLATNARLFRGGDSFQARLGVDVKAAADGLIHPLGKNGKPQGISLNINPHDPFIQKYGGAFPVNSLPERLQALQSGKPGHFVIGPKTPMTFEEFQRLLNQVKLGDFNVLP